MCVVAHAEAVTHNFSKDVMALLPHIFNFADLCLEMGNFSVSLFPFMSNNSCELKEPVFIFEACTNPMHSFRFQH